MSEPVTSEERDLIGRQLGRPPRAVVAVAHRCPCGQPDVVETAPRLEDAADAVTGTVAPKVAETVTGTLAPRVSSALRSTARQVRPNDSRTGVRRLLSLRWLFVAGAVAAAAGAGAAIAMRRRYASATAEAPDLAAAFGL